MAKNKLLNEKLRSDQEMPEGLSWDAMENGILQRMPMKPLPQKSSFVSSAVLLGAVLFVVVLIGGYLTLNQVDSPQTISQGLKETAVAVESHIAPLEAEKVNPDYSLDKAVQNNNTVISNPVNDNPAEVITKRAKENPIDINNIKSEIAQATEKRNQQIVARKNTIESVTQNVTNRLKNNDSEIAETLTGNTSESGNSSIISSKSASTYPEVGKTRDRLPLHSEAQSLTQTPPNSDTQSPTAALPVAIPEGGGKQELRTTDLIQNIATIDRVEIKLYPLDQTIKPLKLSQQMIAMAASVAPVEPLGQAKRLAVEMGLGTTYWLANNGGGDVADAKSSYEKALLSFGSNFTIAYQLNQDWSLSGGIGYQKMETLFDYEVQFDTTIVNNLVYTKANATRIVKRNNKYTSYTIPVMVHKSWGSGQLEFMAGLGVSYRFNAGATGKTLEVNDEGNYDVVLLEEMEPLRSDTWNANAQVAMRYALSDKFYAGLNANVSTALSRYDLKNGVTQRPLWLQGALLIGRRF